MEQQGNNAVAAGVGVIVVLGALFVGLLLYLFFCFCCKKICEKCGHNPGILIWIPIANLVPLLTVAQMPLWMIILFFIPVVNLVIAVMMWAKICSARGKSPWLVVLMFIPIVNLIFIPYLAFSE